MTDRQLMQQALDALEELNKTNSYWWQEVDEATLAQMEAAITALDERLARCDRCGKKMGGEGDIHTCTPDPIGDAQDRLIAEIAAQPEQEPVAWEDGPHLVVRSDMRDRLNYKGPWVDMGRAIPDKWIPVLYTTPPAQPAVPDFKAFKEWAAGEGYDVAYTHDGIKWVCLNPMTADLWKAWQAAHGIKENT